MTAHLVDSALYGHLWGTDEVRSWFTDEGRLRGWLDVLVALAEAQAAVGVMPAQAATGIRTGVDGWLPDPAEVGRRTRECGHSTLGLIRVLQERLPEDAREWVYYGATVQDLTDTWSALVMRAMTDVAVRDVQRMLAACRDLAVRYRDTVMNGRTHGQPGLPITFGFKAAVWASELERHVERLEQARPRRELVQLGGGLGTMEFWGGAAAPMIAEFGRRLDLGVPTVPWLTARDGFAEFVAALAMVGSTVAKIGDEVLQLQRPEIGELREAQPVGTVGSITMPHKRNPEWAEHVGTLARLLRVQADLSIEGMIHGHERDGRAWKTEWVVLPETCLFSSASLAAGVRILEGLEVDAERMRANLEDQRGYVLSEPVMRALADRIGKHSAHEAVYEAARNGRASGLSLRDALRADARTSLVSDADLDALLDPTRALGEVGRYVDAITERGR